MVGADVLDKCAMEWKIVSERVIEVTKNVDTYRNEVEKSERQVRDQVSYIDISISISISIEKIVIYLSIYG